MANPKAELQSILATQQQTLQQVAQFQEQFAETLQRLSLSQASTEKMVRSHPTLDTLAASISEFDYDPSTEDTFEAWFSRKKTSSTLKPRSSMMQHAFGCCYASYGQMYTRTNKASLNNDDYITYGGIVNREFQRFQLDTLSEDNFKCLIFVCGLQSPDDAAVRLKLLNKIETEPNVTIAKLVDECNHLRNLKYDTEMVQQSAGSDPLEVDKVAAKRNSRSTFTQCDRSPHKQPA
ncbi:hypothetical protein TTRE_0000964401, partial [Trichuris trichiura]